MTTMYGMLNDLGMKAEGVSTGMEAVEQVVLHHQQKRDYFACIIDWRMPDMDGIATTRAIRKAVGRDVPIIIISAYDWSDIEQEARTAGANAFISKPLFRSRLVKTFSSLVDRDDFDEQITPFAQLETMNLKGNRALLVEDNELNAEIATHVYGSSRRTPCGRAPLTEIPDVRLSRIRLFTKRIVHIYHSYTLTYILGLTNG